MKKTRGLTLVELVIAFSVISIVFALFLPTLQAARERSRASVCQNNLRQLDLALQRYMEITKKMPTSGAPGIAGGWATEILPLLDSSISSAVSFVNTPYTKVPVEVLKSPPIFQCPSRTARVPSSSAVMSEAHYVLVAGKASLHLFDAPLDESTPWLSSPIFVSENLVGKEGPHLGGFYFVKGKDKGVGFLVDGVEVK